MAPFFQLAIKIGIQRVERAGGGEPLTEHADRVRVGCRRAKVEARETQPTQPVADQVLHVHVAHFVFASPVPAPRSEEHTSELQSLMRISYAVFGLNKQNI